MSANHLISSSLGRASYSSFRSPQLMVEQPCHLPSTRLQAARLRPDRHAVSVSIHKQPHDRHDARCNALKTNGDRLPARPLRYHDDGVRLTARSDDAVAREDQRRVSLSVARELNSLLHSELPFSTTFINLDTRQDRLEHMQSVLRKAGLPATRFPAYTGEYARASDVGFFWDSTLNSHFDEKTLPTTLKLSPGERGCAASHARLWRSVAQLPLDAPPLLILEDDLLLREDCVPWCSTMVKAIHRTHGPEERALLLYLGAHVAMWYDGTRVSDEEARRAVDTRVAVRPVLKEAAYLWYTSSYMIWPAAARILVAALPMDAPVDCFLARMVLTRQILALVSQPNLAWQKAPCAKGDIVHTNAFKPHVQISTSLRLALAKTGNLHAAQSGLALDTDA